MMDFLGIAEYGTVGLLVLDWQISTRAHAHPVDQRRWLAT